MLLIERRPLWTKDENGGCETTKILFPFAWMTSPGVLRDLPWCTFLLRLHPAPLPTDLPTAPAPVSQAKSESDALRFSSKQRKAFEALRGTERPGRVPRPRGVARGCAGSFGASCRRVFFTPDRWMGGPWC